MVAQYFKQNCITVSMGTKTCYMAIQCYLAAASQNTAFRSAALLSWCSVEISSRFNERRSESPCVGEQYTKFMELTMYTGGWKQKLGGLERLWLTGLTTFEFWAAFSRA